MTKYLAKLVLLQKQFQGQSYMSPVLVQELLEITLKNQWIRKGHFLLVGQVVSPYDKELQNVTDMADISVYKYW